MTAETRRSASPPRPPSRSPKRRRGSPPPSRPPAERSSSCPTGSTPNPEPAFEEHQAAAWVAEALARHGFAVEHPAGSLATAVRGRLARRSGRRRPADRDPRRVRRAAGPRPRLRPQHDGGLGRRRGDRPGRDRRRAAGRDRLPRHAGRGAGQRQADHDRRRPVRRARRGAPLPPLRPRPRRDPAARLARTSTSSFHGPPGPRRVRAVDGQERPRRDDPAVQLGRAVAPAAPAGLPASTGSSRRAAPRRTSSRTGRRPGSCSAAPSQAVLRGDERRGSASCARRRPWRPARRSRSTFSGGASTMKHNRDARATACGRTWRPTAIVDQGPRPEPRAAPTWATSAGSARRSTPTSRSATRASPGHSIQFRDAAARPGRTRSTLLAATLVAQTAYELFADPALVEAAWREFREAEPGSADARRTRCYHRRRRAPLDVGCEPAAPPARRLVPPRPARSRPPSPGGPRGRAPPRPRPDLDRRLRGRSTAGTASTRRSATSTCRPTSARPTFMKLPWITDAAELARAEAGRRDRRRPVRRRRQPPPGRPVRPAGDPRGAVHVGLDPLAPARRRAVRGPRRRRRGRREHRPGLDRPRPTP